MSLPCEIDLNRSAVFQGNFWSSTSLLYESIQTNSSADVTVVLAVSSPITENCLAGRTAAKKMYRFTMVQRNFAAINYSSL